MMKFIPNDENADMWEADSISDIARTEGFYILILALESLYMHHKNVLVEESGSGSIESVRFQAGRLSGLGMAINRLKQSRKGAQNG